MCGFRILLHFTNKAILGARDCSCAVSEFTYISLTKLFWVPETVHVRFPISVKSL